MQLSYCIAKSSIIIFATNLSPGGSWNLGVLSFDQGDQYSQVHVISNKSLGLPRQKKEGDHHHDEYKSLAINIHSTTAFRIAKCKDAPFLLYYVQIVVGPTG